MTQNGVVFWLRSSYTRTAQPFSLKTLILPALDHHQAANDIARMASFLDNKQAVDEVPIVVHSLGAWPNCTISDNHGSIYLFVANRTSVRMNMRAGLEDSTGHLEWNSLNYALTNSAVDHWDYQARTGTTVGAIYRLIYQRHCDNYTMSGWGSGCRWWM